MKGKKGRIRAGLRKLASVVVSAAMVVSCMAVPAFALDTTNTNPGGKFAGSSKLTLTSATSISNGKMQLFQIFSGDISGNTLANIEWGESIKSSTEGGYDVSQALITALKADKLPSGKDNVVKTFFSSLNENSTAQDVAAGLTAMNGSDGASATADQTAAFSEIVFSVVSSTQDANDGNGTYYTFTANYIKTQETVTNPDSDDTYQYVFTGLHHGYYMAAPYSYTSSDVDGVTRHYRTGSTDMLSRFILQVVGDAQIGLKRPSEPTVEKKIATNPGAANETLSDAAGVSIGQEVTFKVTSTVPNMVGFTKYLYGLQDTMSEGLDYVGIDSVWIQRGEGSAAEAAYQIYAQGDSRADANKWYRVIRTSPNSDGTAYVEDNNGRTINITFNNFIQYAGNGPVTVTVYYKAKLNEKAIVGISSTASGRNVNDVEAVYSNSPVWIPDTDIWNPTGNDPVAVTPKDEVYLFTTNVKLLKQDSVGAAPLAGATFKIEPKDGKGTVATILTVTEKFVLANDVTSTTDVVGSESYYKLADGTGFTNAAGIDLATLSEDELKKYELGTGGVDNPDTYKLIRESTWKTAEAANPVSATTDNSGVITFTGLGTGEYVITEVEAPTGYNKLKNPIELKIELIAQDGGYIFKFSRCEDGTVTGDGTPVYGNEQYNTCSITVNNVKGSTLPSTGGIGTTIFYVVGTVLVIGAGIALVTRRRMRKSVE